MYKTEGIVLKKIDAGEADAFLVIYTKDFGKIRALAQGVKKEEAKLKGHLEPLSHVSVNFILGKNGERLTGAELLGYWPATRLDPQKLAAAWYFAGLFDTHCYGGQKDERLWGLLLSALSLLEENNFSGAELKKFLDEFEAKFLENMGYGGGEPLEAFGASVARPWGQGAESGIMNLWEN